MRKSCPSCQKTFKLSRRMQDQAIRCPHCDVEVTFLSREPKNPRARSSRNSQTSRSVPQQTPPYSIPTAGPANSQRYQEAVPIQYVEAPSHSHLNHGRAYASSVPAQQDVRFISNAVPARHSFASTGFRCPRCTANTRPYTRNRISSAGWVTVVLLAIFFFPLFWVGFFITEPQQVCSTCGHDLG